MPTVIPATGYRYYSKIPNSAAQSPIVSVGYCADTGVIWQQQDGTIVTGAVRPVFNTDLGTTSNTQLSVSGLNLTVGAVSITGFNSGSALGNLDLTRTYLPTSGIGTGLVNVTNLTLNVAVTGGSIQTIVTGTIGGTVQVNSVTITGNPGVVVTGGQLSGSALGNLDVTRTYLPISGAAGSFIAIDTGIRNISGSAQGNLDLTRSYLPISGAGGVFVVALTGLQSVLAVQTGTLTASIAAGTSVAVTGGTINVLDNSGWAFLAAISGSLVTSLTAAAPVTGDIRNIPGTVLAISGFVNTIVTGTVSSTISNPIGVTGASLDKALPTVLGSTNFLAIGGRVVNPSGGGSITGYNSTGDLAMLNIAPNGGVYTNQAILDQTQDNVTIWAANTGIGPLTALSGAAAPFFGIALPNNPNRRAWFAVNLGTGGLMIKMSATIPTTGNLDLFLGGATTPWAGNGQSWTDSPAIYTGPVAISGFGGAPCVYRLWEL